MAASICARPAGFIRPCSISSNALLRFLRDHLLADLRGVKADKPVRIVILFEPSVDPSLTERGVYRLGLCQRRVNRPLLCKLDPDPGRVAWLRAEPHLERCQVREGEHWPTRMLLRHAEASAPKANREATSTSSL